MTSVDSVMIYDLNAVGLFALDAADVEYDNQRSVENLDIPGVVWNTWFDNASITGRWNFSGIFKATDITWDPATTGYNGRPLDFIHYFKTTMNQLDSHGALKAGDQYRGLQIVLHQVFNGTDYSYNINKAYNSDGQGQDVVLLLEKFNCKHKGGTPGAVEWSFSVVEIAEVINLGV